MVETWFQIIVAVSLSIAAAALAVIAFTGRTTFITITHLYKTDSADEADWWKNGNDETEGE